MRRLLPVILIVALVLGGCSPGLKRSGWGVETADMDLTVRPGEDFYDYAVGAWIDRVEVPGDDVCVGVNSDLDSQLMTDIGELIDEAAEENAATGTSAQQITDLYTSYVDQGALDDLGDEPVRGYLAEIDGVTDRTMLADTVVDFARRMTLISDPFPIYVWVDALDPSRYLPTINQGGLSLDDRDYYIEPDYEDVRAEFVDHVARTLRLAGYDDADEQARAVMRLETALAEVQWPLADTYDVEATSTVMPQREVEKLGAGAPLAQLFDAYGLAPNTDFVVGMPDVLEATARLFATEPVEDWKAYMRYQVLLGYGDYLSQPYLDEMFSFYEAVLNGTETQSPHEAYGPYFVSTNLSDLVGERFVDRHFTPDTKQRAMDLVESVRAAYGEMIDGATWMSEPTKAEARAKLATLLPKVGYPDKWTSFDGLDIRADDLVGNAERMYAWSFKSYRDRLNKPTDRTDWAGSAAQENNAYYFAQFNDLVFPAGILQPPFFDPRADAAVNYGGIGATMGHEMTHAFDSEGRKADSRGVLRDWWAPADAERYEAQTELLVEQFDGYEPLPGEHIDGVLTLAENIADLAGLEAAYDAYRASLNGEEAPVIDGFTGDQRFFLAYAASWRELCREEYVAGGLQTDNHSPAEFRVNGIVRNLDAWYDAFDVKEGDALYLAPEDRVRIW